MKGFLAVARREFVEKRLVLVAAAVGSSMPFLLMAVRSRGHSLGAPEDRILSGYVMAAFLVAALSIAFGASILAREAAEKRLGFYFSRPISGASLWTGKLVGAASIVGLSAAIMMAPACLLPASADHARSLASAAMAATLLSIPVILFVHGVTLAVRVKSAWSVLDVVLLAAVAATIHLSFRVVTGFPHMQVERMIEWACALVLAVPALIVATALSVSHGRTSAPRSSRFFSIGFWSFAIPVVGALGVAVLAFVSPGISSLRRVGVVVPAPTGDKLYLVGEASWHRVPGFLVDASTGAHRLTTLDGGNTSLAFSLNGSRAAWVRQPVGSTEFEIATADLSRTELGRRDTGISVSGSWVSLALSPSGRRLAFSDHAEPRLVAVHDLTSRKLLASINAPGSTEPHVFFAGEDLVRLAYFDYEFEGGHSNTRMRVEDFHVAARRLVSRGEVVLPAYLRGHTALNDAGSRLAVTNGKAIAVVDLDAMKAVLLIDGPIDAGYRTAALLSDGRILVGQGASKSARLDVYAANGTLEQSIALPAAQTVEIGGEPEIGSVYLSLHRADGPRPWWIGDLYRVTVASGEVRKIADDLVPAVANDGWIASSPYRPSPGSPGVFLFLDKNLSLVRLDPVTGARHALAGNGAS